MGGKLPSAQLVQACWAHIKQGARPQALISIRGEKGGLLKHHSLPAPSPTTSPDSAVRITDYRLHLAPVCLALPFTLLGTFKGPWVLTLLCSPGPHVGSWHVCLSPGRICKGMVTIRPSNSPKARSRF